MATSRPAPRSQVPIPPSVMMAAFAAAMLGVASHVLGKAVRDTLFLSSFPVEWLPYAFIATGVVSGLVLVVYTRLSAALSPRRVVPAMALLIATVYVPLYLWLRVQGQVNVAVLYVWVSITGGLIVSGFWTLLSERFDPRAGRRVYGFVGVSSTIGGLLGGLGAHWCSGVMDPEAMLLILAGTNFFMAVSMQALKVPVPSKLPSRLDDDVTGGLTDAFRLVGRTPYLRSVAALAFAITVAGTLGDYVLKERAAEMLSTKRELAEFFSLFHGTVGAVTLGVQLLIARPLVAKKGVAAALVALPIWLVLGAAAVLVSPGLAAATALRGGENAVRNSFHRSGYELLFIPLSQSVKRITKPILDTFLERVADGFGAILILLMVAIAGVSAGGLSWIILALGAASVYLVVRVQDGYVKTLSSNLVARAVELTEVANAADDDATAREAIRSTLIGADRQELRRQLSKSRMGASIMQSLQLEALPGATLRRYIPSASKTTRSAIDDPIVTLFTQLFDSDAAQVKLAIKRWDQKDRRPVAVLIRLLARQELYPTVIEALAGAGDRVAGTMADHLSDQAETFAVRRRLPRALASCRSPVAINALTAGLSDGRFEVRYHCAAALRRIRDNHSVTFDSGAIWTAIREEVKKSRPMWAAQRLLDEENEPETEAVGALHRRGNHSLRQVFQLLALVLDAQPIELSLQAVLGDEPQLRGVALEYLENVLPADVRRSLWPHIGDEPPEPPTSRRSIDAVMRELTASSAQSSASAGSSTSLQTALKNAASPVKTKINESTE